MAACCAALMVPLVAGHSALAARPMCFGKRATRVGTDGYDRIRGTLRADIIVSRGGVDDIWGLGGNDRICSGPGADNVSGGGGADRVNGGTDDDAILGGDGDDVILLGDGLYQQVDGGPGNDKLTAASEGLDFVVYSRRKRAVRVDLTRGTATGQGSDTLNGFGGVVGSSLGDRLTGTTGGNVIYAGAGPDVIITNGNSGSMQNSYSYLTFLLGLQFDIDFVEGGGGNDNITGGAGLNVATYDDASAGVQVDLAAGEATGGQGTDTLTGIQTIIGSAFADTLLGDASDNGFEPSGGNDTIDGRDGADVLIALSAHQITADLGTGIAVGDYRTDTGAPIPSNIVLASIENVWGSVGGDDITGSDGPNQVLGLFAADAIRGMGGDDYLHGGGDIDSLDGGDGTDTCIAGETNINCETVSSSAASGSRRRGMSRGAPRAPLAAPSPTR